MSTSMAPRSLDLRSEIIFTVAVVIFSLAAAAALHAVPLDCLDKELTRPVLLTAVALVVRWKAPGSSWAQMTAVIAVVTWILTILAVTGIAYGVAQLGWNTCK